MKRKILSIFVLLAAICQADEWPESDHPYGLVASDARLDPLCQQLQMPPVSDSGLVQTMNYGGGFMLIHLDPVSAQFIDFAKTCSLPILDIGSAYGIATLPALKNSSCAVIADDIGADNLLILRKLSDEQERGRLFLTTKRFPQELNFTPNSLGSILICRVLHFLRGEEIEQGFEKIYEWLAPGGKVFIVTSTPYQGNLTTFVPVYEERWASGNLWPGYVEDYGLNAPGVSHNLFPFLHVMDERPLRRALEAVGFEIEQVQYIDRRQTIPKTSLNGQEGIGIIAVKPGK
jgi:SAM-dependent methyltransferase